MRIGLVIVVVLLAAGCTEKETPPCPVGPEPKQELNVREGFALAASCAKAAPYDGRGVGGSPLRFDGSASIHPMSGAAANHIYTVQLYEETRTTAPSGLVLGIDAYRKTCSPVRMD